MVTGQTPAHWYESKTGEMPKTLVIIKAPLSVWS